MQLPGKQLFSRTAFALWMRECYRVATISGILETQGFDRSSSQCRVKFGQFGVLTQGRVKLRVRLALAGSFQIWALSWHLVPNSSRDGKK